LSRFSVVGPIHPLRGGIAQHTAGIVGEARRRGHDVRVVSYRRQYPALLFPGRTQLSAESIPPEAARGAVPSIDSLAPWSWIRTATEISRARPELVVLQRWHPYFAPALATIAARVRSAGARIAWLVHNARPHDGGRIPWGPLLTLGMRSTDTAFAHAATEEEALRELGCDLPVHVVPMPAPASVTRADPRAARTRLHIGAEETVFLFVGHVRAYKGVDVLLRALGRLREPGPPWRAVVAGEWYIDRGEADARLSEPPLAGRVSIDDSFISEEKLADYFAAATVVVLPYRSGTQSAVVPLSYAHGRPVVTTGVGGLAEAVVEGETGLLVPPEDVDRLAAALQAVRAGRTFSPEAIARAHAAASFAPLVDAFEAIVRPSLFP